MKKEYVGKNIYFEVIRIIACALVIFNHSPGYRSFLFDPHTFVKQWLYIAIAMMTRIHVPLFFMISGALLLPRKSNYSYIIKKKTPRILIVLFVFQIVVYCLYTLTDNGFNLNHETFSYNRLFYGLFSNKLKYCFPYWFLYAYLGFLLFLPFMQRIAAGLEKEDVIVMLLIHFALNSVIPVANLILNSTGRRSIVVTDHFSVPFAAVKAFFYPLLGYYLEHCVDRKSINTKIIRRLLCISLLGIVVSCGCTYWDAKLHKGVYTEKFVELFDYVIAVAVYILIKYLYDWVRSKAWLKAYASTVKKTIIKLGSATFGMYLFDPVLKLLIFVKYEKLMLRISISNVMIVSIGWIIFSMTAGGTITMLLKKAPGVKKLF